GLGNAEEEFKSFAIKRFRGYEIYYLLMYKQVHWMGGTMESMAALASAASWDPSIALDITAGNASQMSDGSAAMLIADRATADKLGLPVRAAFRHMVVAGDDAVLVLSAPNPATRKLLARSGLTIDDFDAIECN